MRGTVIIMAKAPIMGRAKTRLAADIGLVHAHRLYKMMMSRVIRGVQDPRWDTVLAVTPAPMMHNVPMWQGVPQMPQTSGSLTPRLQAVFDMKGPVVVIGTDCPDVSRTDIADAFKAIKRGHAVLGPADDGGFWLIGLHGPARADLFDNVRWSHSQTMADMAARFSRPVRQLRRLIDVDDKIALDGWRGT
ncbi:DUF2064 domain-containing protein [Fretibacter rubidus]|uniref:TIGR04282 family arsenosugar biosynthesis glycosyltransferase n=1 Tax=Fretibacter rubidus TaxID=570162 RepID=UPI00352BB7FB